MWRRRLLLLLLLWRRRRLTRPLADAIHTAFHATNTATSTTTATATATDARGCVRFAAGTGSIRHRRSNADVQRE